MISINKRNSISEASSTVFPEGSKTEAPQPRPGVSPWPIAILGIPFDALTLDGALERIAGMVEAREPAYVVTPNVDFLVQSRKDSHLRQILLEAHLVLCDGMPLVWASRWLGNPLPERVSGADLTPRLLSQAEEKGHRVYLLGGSGESNEGAVAHLKFAYPNLNIAGHYSPPFRCLEEMDNEDIIRRVRATNPDIVLVSFGCPKQEKWMAEHYRSLGAPVCIGVGATIDFLAGKMKRAPRWMQRLGLESVFRLLQEPRRLLMRYAGDFRYFAPAILTQYWRLRRGKRRSRQTASVSMASNNEDRSRHVSVSGALDWPSIDTAAEVWKTVRYGGNDCVLDLSRVKFIDCTGAALLWEQRKNTIKSGHRLTLLPPSAEVMSALIAMGVMEAIFIEHSKLVLNSSA
ncbi:MAG: WecB/TagA/CpsF family glycosyltransferase [Opitutales bacterium]|nr:WecB/TagA/CpsF family glycosyltransferase [Opitutales bacterium]